MAELAPRWENEAAADRFPAMSFDIHDVAPAQRCDALVEAIDRAYYPCETRFLSDLHRGRMRCVEVGPVRMGYGDVDPMRVDRSPAMLRRAAGDYVFLPLPLREGIRLTQRGRSAWVGPDSFACIATAEVYSYEQPRPLELYTLRIAAAAVRDRIRNLEDMTVRPLSARSGAGALFLDYALAFCRNARSFDRATGSLSVNHLLDLLALSLQEVGPAPDASEAAMREAHRQRIRRYLDSRLGDPGLGTESIAGAFGLSERYLQKLFAESGETLSRLIRDRRIAEAQRLLSAPGARSLAIATIAYRTGYADPAYFSRVFREATGLSPREYRAQAAERRG
ncbi:AraC family transcriptional regulator [Marinibaculum pumilum]|uniref:AraC family transcriptional regulator n=1 Tax=Marinibaculum pumilum TaxID=1766165 RepID=A0ABV7L7V8_9PROT